MSVFLRFGIALFVLVFVTFFCNFSEVTTNKSSKHHSSNKLLLILLDGFRWDYLNKTDLTGFAKLRKAGVHAEYMLPIFPSVSIPDFYSIATGLYGEDHGMIMNLMYDPKHGDIFQMNPVPNSSQTYWWDGAEPIWITSTKRKTRTFVYSWPGSEILIRDTRPTFFVAHVHHHNDSIGLFHTQIGQVLQNFANDEADFGIVYTDYTDATGHKFGPESKEMDEAIHKVDVILDEMLQNMTTLGLQNCVNTIIVSDHGMTNTGDASVMKESLKDVLNIDDVQLILDRGTYSAIYPVDGKLDAVYDSLKKLKGAYVWKRDDIPERFHFKKHPRCPPILVLMKPGYVVGGYTQSKKQVPYLPNENDAMSIGQHGYDVSEMPDMRAIFLAAGPDIRQKLEAHPINNTDVYNLAMYLLGLDPLPNNGTWDHVKGFLRKDSKD